MNLEPLVSEMMRVNVLARLWHWTTDVAQHHLTYEQFLTQNETFTDSLVESSLGNDINLSFDKIGVTNATLKNYSLDEAKKELNQYRSKVLEVQKSLEASEVQGSSELITILDDAVENTSKTLYLLRLK
jgi:hypothetical protein